MQARRKISQDLSLVIIFLLCSGFSLSWGSGAQAGLADHAVINEIQIDGLAGTGGTEDDWVELHNPTGADISLSGWSLQKLTESGTTITREPLTGIINAGGYFLIVRNGTLTNQALITAADHLAADAFSLAANNTVVLVNDNINISGLADPNIVDVVGYGSALNFEGSSAAANISEGKSLSRVPDGEDTDENSLDLAILDTPTPQSASEQSSDIGGTVAVTITPDATPVRNIGAESVGIVFRVNSLGNAHVVYGSSNAYGEISDSVALVQNTDMTINLIGLECGLTYHYSIIAENHNQDSSDQTADATFETMPCGIALNSLVMTKDQARANDNYVEGWEWQFNLTVWNEAETSLKMRFNQWTGAGSLSAGGNMRFSVDGAAWVDISADNTYPGTGVDLSGVDLSTDPGRQVLVRVQMKVPVGTLAGDYDSSWGILTE